jgi:hypothetical protein
MPTPAQSCETRTGTPGKLTPNAVAAGEFRIGVLSSIGMAASSREGKAARRIWSMIRTARGQV